ncbi:MAG: Asp-tRNA(Asn)/Glu-tRNA(Gln) amidotransferase subunit GatB [Alphaproteobacteria bacterium GM7ARS4]|nr:Asp-tRNA(Asn)/Glu-tRNA(Gln) amidotransferase subunit GatB [Alphaproteobacteria bacterium GM7ARS4]
MPRTPSSAPSTSWDIVIGLEVHAQIASTSKLFSRTSTQPFADANSSVSLIDAAMPGMLPIPNQKCIDQAITTALAFDADIQHVSLFDRKHYFYPDLPQGYQISQYHKPIALGGHITIDDDKGQPKDIPLTRLHIEQDAGKSLHDLFPHATAIDLNRSGVGLMEIVFEPSLRSSGEAVSLMHAIRQLLRYLGTCDGNMEAGNLRADVNVSVRQPHEPLGTRCEIKNLNSMRFIQQAIDYEAQRHISLREKGQTITQQTRLFNTNTQRTYAMRSKEEAHDYRYFPDPDLPPLVLDPARIQKLKEQLPERPREKYQRFLKDYGLKKDDVALLVAERDIAQFFEETARTTNPVQAARWVIGPLFALLNKRQTPIQDSPISPQRLSALIDAVEDGTLSERTAKDVLITMATSGKTARDIIQQENLAQISDDNVLNAKIHALLQAHPDKVTAYQQGKTRLLGFFVGEIMRETKGKAHPQKVNALLQEKLKKAP